MQALRDLDFGTDGARSVPLVWASGFVYKKAVHAHTRIRTQAHMKMQSVWE